MQEPLISLIIPVYNVEKYLIRCLDSVMAQEYNNFECILVDDGSKDSSGNICDSYAQKSSIFNVIHAEAFYMSENEACRRLYKGFIGYGQAVQNVKDILLKNLSDLEKEQAIGENRHDEILYIQQFLDELKNDKVCGVRQVENIK